MRALPFELCSPEQFLGIATLYTDTFTFLIITKSHDDVRAITKWSEDIFRIATNYNYILIEFTQHQVNIFGQYDADSCILYVAGRRNLWAGLTVLNEIT